MEFLGVFFSIVKLDFNSSCLAIIDFVGYFNLEFNFEVSGGFYYFLTGLSGFTKSFS